MKGDFENIFKFSKVLENGIPFVQEGSIEIAAKDKSSVVQAGKAQGPIILTSDIDFNYYYY